MVCACPKTTFRRRNDSSRVVGGWRKPTVDPSETPISVAEAKKQIEYPTEASDHDEHLERLIAAATTFLQDQTNRQFVTATYEFTYDQFPPGTEPLWVPRSPLISVASIEYVDEAGATQTMAPADYLVAIDAEPGRISLEALGSMMWPITICQGRAVTVTADCGYGLAEDVPGTIKQVLLFLVDEWFNRRSGTGQIGPYVQALIDSLRIGDDFLQYAPAAGEAAYIGYG